MSPKLSIHLYQYEEKLNHLKKIQKLIISKEETAQQTIKQSHYTESGLTRLTFLQNQYVKNKKYSIL